jgi:hypothetical protein
MFFEAGFEFQVVEEKEKLNETLPQAKVLIVARPSESYGELRDAITDFVARGGTLILIGDRNRSVVENLNELSVQFGIVFNRDYIYDLYHYHLLYSYPRISKFEEHKLTRYLQDFVVYDSPSLTVFGDAQALAHPATTAKSTLGFEEIAVLAMASHGKGYVVAMADGDAWTDENLGQFDNHLLLTNLINWIQVKEEFELRHFPLPFSIEKTVVGYEEDFKEVANAVLDAIDGKAIEMKVLPFTEEEKKRNLVVVTPFVESDTLLEFSNVSLFNFDFEANKLIRKATNESFNATQYGIIQEVENPYSKYKKLLLIIGPNQTLDVLVSYLAPRHLAGLVGNVLVISLTQV